MTNQKLAGNIDWSKINSSSIPVGAIHHTRINFSGFSVPAGSVGTSQIVDGAVTNDKFSSNAADKLDFSKVNVPDGAITTTMIGDNQITNSKLAGNINWSKIDAASIPNSSISHTKVNFSGFSVPAGSVGTSQIVDGAVTNAKFSSNAADKLDFSKVNVPDGAITTTMIGDNQITNSKLAGNINWSKIDAASIPNSSISHTKIDFTGYTVPANSVGTTQLQDDAVNSEKIADGTITDADFSTDPGDRLSHTKVNFSGWTAPNNSVNSASVIDNSLTADDLANDAVDTAEIKDGAVTSSKILDGTITDADFSSDPGDRLSHTKVNFSGWTAPNNSVDTASIQNGAVTNAKINIDTGGSLPYHTFLSTVTLTAAAGTGYIPLIGYNLIPQATETGLTASNGAFACTSGTITVVLDTAPGSGNSRTFELRDGATTITGSSITISDINTTGSINFSSIPSTANLVLHADVSGTPAAARATIYFVCK